MMNMADNLDNTPGVRIPGNRQGGDMVPVSPRSGLRAESREGPQPGEGLPAGPQPGIATADGYRSNDEENNLVRSIVDSYLGSNEPGAAGPSNAPNGGNVNEDAMSASSIITGSTNLKRTRNLQVIPSDPEEEDRPHRSHKVLRSRIIVSDSDNDRPGSPIVLSDSPENVKKVKRRRARAQKRDVILAPPMDLDLSADLANLVFTNCPSHLIPEDVASKDAEELAGISSGWLDDMELVRTKSKRMNGRLSGCLKDRIAIMRSMIRIMVERIKDSGDVSYLRRRNDELTSQLREARREETRLQEFLKEAEVKAEKLSTEIFELRRRIGSISAEPERFPSLPNKGRQGTPIKPNTPKKERNVTRGTSAVETLRGCDAQLEFIAKYDEKIIKLEELLHKIKTDFYGSVELVADKVGKTMTAVDPPKRGAPKIISNIQLVPPRPTPGLEQKDQEEPEPFSDLESWTEVTGRRNKRRVKIAAGANFAGPTGVTAGLTTSDRSGGRPYPTTNPGNARRRAPRNAAVSIKANTVGLSYAEIIKQAREKVNLKELGIVNPRMRRAANGGVIIEIAGPEGAVKADSLVSRLREVIGDSAVVSRPVVKADLKISGFDESVLKDEVITVLTESGECLASDVRVGPFRPMRNGLLMTWVQCPLSAALKISRKNKVNLGWSIARVELMRARPVQCFKCWHFGHVRNNCESVTDRTGHCFRCGGNNHTSYTCLANPFCVVCSESGFDSSHRLGSPACSAMTGAQVGSRGQRQR